MHLNNTTSGNEDWISSGHFRLVGKVSKIATETENVSAYVERLSTQYGVSCCGKPATTKGRSSESKSSRLFYWSVSVSLKLATRTRLDTYTSC